MTTDDMDIPKYAPNDYDDGIVKVSKAGKTIPLVEMFGPTIQGEGNVIGQQTYFLRFGLCDYKCTMCDSLHAVLPQLVKKNARWITQEQIYDDYRAFRKPMSTNWVTFSGGNPAIHDLRYLVERLQGIGAQINVETQGTKYQPWLNLVDNLTVSPKGPGMGETHDQGIFMTFMDEVYKTGLTSGIRGPGDDPRPVSWWPTVCIKIVAFDQRDLEFAAEVFTSLADHPLFRNVDTTQVFYLSLGNPNPPNAETRNNPEFSIPELFQQYRILQEDIATHPVLSQVRFLPQFHTVIWGNGDGH